MDKLDKTWFCTTNIQWTELVCEFTTVVELETFRGFNFCTVLKMTIPELELPSFNCFRFIIWKLARVFANHSKSLQNEVLLSIRFESRPHCWNLALKGAYCSVRVGQNMLLFLRPGKWVDFRVDPECCELLKTVFWTDWGCSSARGTRHARIPLNWVNQNVYRPAISSENHSEKSRLGSIQFAARREL